MAVIIRLQRLGRRNLPHYRVVAIDRHEHREGKANAILGTYDPRLPDKNIQVDIAAVQAWIEKGAQYSDSVASLLKREGYEIHTPEQLARQAKHKAAAKAKRKSRAKQDGKAFVPAKRRAVRKHLAGKKAERLATSKAAAEKRAAEKTAAAPAEGAPQG